MTQNAISIWGNYRNNFDYHLFSIQKKRISRISFFKRYHILVSKSKYDVPRRIYLRLGSSDRDTEIRRIWHKYSRLQKLYFENQYFVIFIVWITYRIQTLPGKSHYDIWEGWIDFLLYVIDNIFRQRIFLWEH